MNLPRVPATALAFLLGIPLALFTGILAIGLAGAGHGWITPLWISGAGLACFPLGVYALLRGRSMSRNSIRGLFALAILTDLAVVMLTFNEGTRYFHGDDADHLLWIGLWLSWQMPILLALFVPKDDFGTL